MSKQVIARFTTQGRSVVRLVEETLTDTSKVYTLEVAGNADEGAGLTTLFYCLNFTEACRQFDVLKATIGQDSTIPPAKAIADVIPDATLPIERFEKALAAFIKVAQAKVDEHMKQYKSLPPEPLVIRNALAARYVAIDKKAGNGQTFVYCFVDRTNGDVLKADSYKRPAKHARSNIYNADHGASGVTWHGGAYLR